MRIKLSKKTSYVLIVLVALIMIGINLFILLDYERSYNHYLQYQQESFQRSISDIFYTYEQFSKYIFETQINTEETTSILNKACHSGEEEKNVLRARLLEMYEPVYDSISKYNFGQLHFHLPDGESLLRVHYPEEYGDDLFSVRESVRIANETEYFVTGFEEGRTYSGYRYVYPLSHNGTHVGSVEVSLSVDSVLEELHEEAKGRFIFFVLSKEIVENLVFDEGKENFEDTFFSELYLSNKITHAHADMENHGIYDEAGFAEDFKKMLGSKLEETDESFSMGLKYQDQSYLVLFSSVANVSNENVGYFVSITPDDQLEAMNKVNIRWVSFSLVTMVITILLMIFLLRKQSEIEKLAMIDQLTKIYNRRFFFEIAEKELKKARRHLNPACIAMVDIDHFKRVNDTHGHPEGDKVLKEIAKIIMKMIREEDIFARYGGEEFVLFMPQTITLDAEIVTERVRKKVEEHNFFGVGKITISIGVCNVDLDKTLIENIDMADEALYQAKNKGRNQVQLYWSI